MSPIQQVRRIVLVVACASAAALLLTAPAPARADDTFAAIAYSQKTGNWNASYGYDNLKAAEQAAIAKCDGDDAQVVVTVKNGWCALATGDGGAYGYGYDTDLGAARKTALTECRKRSANSRVAICVSSSGAQKFAAVAYAPKTGAWGYGDNFDTQKGAQQEALAECKGDDAQIVAWASNGWCALAVGDNGGWGTDRDSDLGAARKAALAACAKVTTNSHILICVSSDGKVKKQ